MRRLPFVITRLALGDSAMATVGVSLADIARILQSEGA